MTDLGLYVHLPFCRARCTYCAFAISTDRSRESEYVSALLREIEGRPAPSLPVVSIFWGGGTPSLLSADALRRLDAALRTRFEIASGAEVSLEANPEDISAETLALWSSVGVNRLSLGIQSLSDEELYPLGRGHARLAAVRALELACRDGRFRISADLILGLPSQSVESFERSLREAIDGGVGHLSLYMLDLEEGSNLRRFVEAGRVTLPEEGIVASMYAAAIQAAGAAGFRQYEVSNFARPGEECVHNRRYWRREGYLGFGLGAHSFIADERFANSRNLDEYVRLIAAAGSAETFRERISPVEEREERLLLSLRQAEGVEYAELVRLCGPQGTEWAERGVAHGWLRWSGARVAFTKEGFLLSNELISELF